MFDSGGKGGPRPASPGVVGRSHLTFGDLAQAYLEDYEIQHYRSMSTAKPRVGHLREFLGGRPTDAITADAARRYELQPRRDRWPAGVGCERLSGAADRRLSFIALPRYPGKCKNIGPIVLNRRQQGRHGSASDEYPIEDDELFECP